MRPRWVIFDYGEVLSKPSAALPHLAGKLGVGADEFAAAYWAERESYDRGRADHDYWQAIGDRVGSTVSQAIAAELTEADIAGWLHVEDESLALLAELADAGVPLALLSNAPASFGRAVERQPWAKHFEHLVFSGDLKAAKPDAHVWATVLTLLDAEPGDCLFLDDRQVNIDGARSAGLIAELWRGAAHIRPRLTELRLLA